MKRTILFAVMLTLMGGCGKKDRQADEIRILAAASTKDAVQDAAALFKEDEGVKVVVVADSSSTLATQIVNDAPADLFLSANDKWADHVRNEGYAAESRPLLSNMLVLVVPRGNPAGVKKPEDLTAAGVTKIALAGENVPAGMYGRQALKKLEVWNSLEGAKKIIAGKDVRSVLAYVEQGEVEAGIVYDTDARITDKVVVVHTFAPSAHEPIRYPLVLLKAGKEKDVARKFYQFLLSERAAAIFRKHGFTTGLAK